jgi:cytochrome d ubiquinol oxidase subunit II
MLGLIWFWLIALMLAAYVVLDGFDIGAGVLHMIAAQSEEDRQIVLRAIGPVWDGNEVWLIAAGGTLYFAFPLLYASAFSGFYLPLMIVLWLLVLRGIGIELRMHIGLQVWRTFFDGCFSISSALLAFFFGAALANVVRGVPLGQDQYFFLPLWTNWRTGPNPGILDWYTVLGGVLAVVALTTHGASYLVLKTDGELQARAESLVRKLCPLLAGLTVTSLAATIFVRSSTAANYIEHPWAFVIPAVVAASLFGLLVFSKRSESLRAFLCSSLYLVSMLVGAAAALYPALLPSSVDASQSLTIGNASSGHYAMSIGLLWWLVGIGAAAAYFLFVYSMFKGKVTASSLQYGHETVPEQSSRV